MSDVRSSRLRPIVGRFDLRMNNNRYGLIRRTIKRTTEPKVAIKQKYDVNNNESDSDNETHNEQKKVKKNPVPIFAVKSFEPPLVRRFPNQSLQKTDDKKPPSLYDTSKSVQYMGLDEASLFESFNNLTLNELCNKADENATLKLATQKYFEVVYSSMNLDWLIDENERKFTLSQARSLLRHFGSFMSTLTVNANHLEEGDQKDLLLHMIGTHFVGLLFWNN